MNFCNFNNNPKLINLLADIGFVNFYPGHGSANGMELTVSEKPWRRACFYDNRLWGDKRIEFRVMDYGKSEDGSTRYSIYTTYFDSAEDITKNEVFRLIELTKELK